MKKIVYRGVEYREAERVVKLQRYERHERRQFVNGAIAKAVFGSGVYLVSNMKVAAQYAICHAETTWDQAAILRQELRTAGLFSLHEQYGENQLRLDALQSRHSEDVLNRLSAEMDDQEWLDWTGEQIRLYLIEQGYNGICYRISDELTYYICYSPDEQISNISLFSVFDVGVSS
ncbi:MULTISPECIES: hypothetical protein [Brevibacillus]|jgi:hypothetical protein|uniref:Uncharacterized protein n=1 Tax=Brevibacillus borstelensis AK1 TaxID=1300222 RepID=M8DCE6_9BACL|nr:hypothetical protein [Brevibacillus borstelensis]EMT53979.1 hypothetical protein I532_00195 [Brevibacillus borstelensis AK1]KKX53826.1 hypothetical protein X546_15745 [Brevibacillus borstelensis cifa_chp40]MCC0563766.1 hypothetical protein [Brevibacillus borstelensis]MCM3469535.1 hypothetical protein [Brevibacillus borstelensis]MCM3559230.1 hypothetical protein [Brevibacillus borstelensis]